ncbi:hydrogenase iron-sulfur subunit [Candidatus Bathyarchaeota archaeon]|nr:hydrogenase iron-sulfur subunit [Candidatus Bathyarchaeota archaeon]
MEQPKVGVFISDCGKQLSDIIDFDALTNFVKTVPEIALIARASEFWRGNGLQEIIDAIKSGKINRVVVAESITKISDVNIAQAVQDAGLNPYLVEVIDIKDHCAWPHRATPKEATEKAKAMILSAIERAKLLEPIEKLEFPALKSTLIIGAGIAGMQTAVDLADLGFEVNLIEKAPFLGGLSARVGRFFPTDDCAICIQPPTSDVKTITHTSRKCVYRSGFSEIPNINILTNSTVIAVEGVPGNYKVTLEKKPRYVIADRCIACDKCVEICPVETPDEYNANLTNRKAIYMNVPAVHPQVYVIDEDACKFNECAKCISVCPSNAIDLDQKTEHVTLNVGSIVIATGFREFDSSKIKEYHYDEYPDVITNLELARMIDGFGPTRGKIIRPSDGKLAKKIVFIQCAGSRDRRYSAYCSSICCMISLKNASLIKETNPDAEVYICYIDIRTTGREHEYYYERARELGIKFVKGRPTEVYNDEDKGKLIVDVEDALLHRFLDLEADLVVLATAMIPAEGTQELAELLGIELEADGFFKEYNAKLRPTETKQRGIFLCGGATFPKDAPNASLHAHSAAMKATKFMTSGKIVKDLRTAEVNDEYCGDCEFCPITCPYGAISLQPTTEDHFIACVNDLLCEGCGLCVGTCPLNAIELKHSKPNQMTAQMNALMSINGTSNPLVLAFCCQECGHTAVDSSGMAKIEYPANIRIIKVPCAGIVQVNQILEAFKAGAQGVMVVGCKSDGCHYEVGSIKAEKKIDLAKVLLKEYGIEPERLEMFRMVYIEGKQFAEAAKMMTERVTKLSQIKLMGDS